MLTATMRKLSWLLYPPLATAVLLVYWLALAAGTHLPNYAVGPVQYNDKLAHFVAYAGLAFLLCWAWTTRRPLMPLGPVFALVVASLYGIVDELTQLLVPGRSGEFRDWLADTLGATIGIGAFLVIALVSRRTFGSGDSQS
jgi:VanZ family protein